jgi:hypothetical protein
MLRTGAVDFARTRCPPDSDFLAQMNFIIFTGFVGTPISVWLIGFPLNVKYVSPEKNSEFLIKKFFGYLFLKPCALPASCFPV